jgi:hypothetical protein
LVTPLNAFYGKGVNMRILKLEGGVLVKREATDLDQNRIRFNWGYHDGAEDRRKGYSRPDGLTVGNIAIRHFDPIYGLAYTIGYEDREYDGNSERAWRAALARGSVKNGVTRYRWPKARVN